ncbi:MAG: hypothetical protein H0V93_07695 [Euzebyales bacterium]|jgi:hypothetical protein|nr:hypothetical protein [Euzebyales bacterium]
MTAATRHRILLVRQWDTQMGGSGCCGRLGGLDSVLGEASDWSQARTDMEAMGHVYRALRAAVPEDVAEISVVDPRNTAFLVPAIWRDARRRGADRGAAFRNVQAATRQNVVVVDGQVLPLGDPPDPLETVAAVWAALDSEVA